MAKTITARTTPLAFSSSFLFNRIQKTARSKTVPIVITFPKYPSFFMV